VLPATLLLGMVMLLVGDIIAKIFALPINTITALMGIPIVVYIVIRKR
jgi:iron complex transport system permease protein